MHALQQRSTLFATILATLLAGAVLGGIAVAQTTSPPPINACVHTETGAVRIVSAGTECRSQESPITWNVQGPAGPAGTAGEDGPPGPQGDPGPAGAGISSFDDLEGIPCNVESPDEGVIDISYAAAAGGTVSLTCTPTTLYELSVSRSGDGGGTVTSSPAGISCGTDCTHQYASGRTVLLTATAPSGATFTGWGGACSGTSTTCTVTMDAAKSVTTTFVSNRTLTVDVDSDFGVVDFGGGTVSAPGGFSCSTDGGSTQRCFFPFALGSTVTLTALPDSGDSFAGWGGVCSGTSRTCTVTMDANKLVSARFTG